MQLDRKLSERYPKLWLCYALRSQDSNQLNCPGGVNRIGELIAHRPAHKSKA
jgi:hypothetical protein